MTRRLLLAVVLAALPATAFAHLCNDVYQQARDHLAVKVDIRDGQLRIGQEASFRVYLLNTMQQDIAAIGLRVASNEFETRVEPSPDWQGHPLLRTSRGGGTKQYFTVTLRRRPGVPDGRYRVDLTVCNPQNVSQVFKTVDMQEAAGVCTLRPAPPVAVDGLASRQEWEQAGLCTGFSTYSQPDGARDAADQCRVRVAMDDRYLCFLLTFQGGAEATSDAVTVYVAGGPEDRPLAFTFDRVSGEVTSDDATEGVEHRLGEDGTFIECRIPRLLMEPAEEGEPPPESPQLTGYYLNFARAVRTGEETEVSYWRGNPHSVLDPIVYGYFRVGDDAEQSG